MLSPYFAWWDTLPEYYALTYVYILGLRISLLRVFQSCIRLNIILHKQVPVISPLSKVVRRAFLLKILFVVKQLTNK